MDQFALIAAFPAPEYSANRIVRLGLASSGALRQTSVIALGRVDFSASRAKDEHSMILSVDIIWRAAVTDARVVWTVQHAIVGGLDTPGMGVPRN